MFYWFRRRAGFTRWRHLHHFRPVTLVFITWVQSEKRPTWVWSQSGLCDAFRVRSSAIVASVGGGGVVLLAADLIVATIQVSRDYVSAAALRADNLSLLQLIWQHVNESCLKLKANINSHLAKGSECPQSQCIKWFDWQSRERRNNKINCFFKKTAVVLA